MSHIRCIFTNKMGQPRSSDRKTSSSKFFYQKHDKWARWKWLIGECRLRFRRYKLLMVHDHSSLQDKKIEAKLEWFPIRTNRCQIKSIKIQITPTLHKEEGGGLGHHVWVLWYGTAKIYLGPKTNTRHWSSHINTWYKENDFLLLALWGEG